MGWTIKSFEVDEDTARQGRFFIADRLIMVYAGTMITVFLLSVVLFIISLVVFMVGLVPFWAFLVGVSIAYGILFVLLVYHVNQKTYQNLENTLLEGNKKFAFEELKKHIPKRWASEKTSFVFKKFLAPLVKNSTTTVNHLLLMELQCEFIKSLVHETTKIIHQTFHELIDLLEKARRENPSCISPKHYSSLLTTLQHEDIINQMLQHVGQFLSFEEFESGAFSTLYDIYRLKKNKLPKDLVREFEERVSKVLTINNEKVVLKEFLKGVTK